VQKCEKNAKKVQKMRSVKCDAKMESKFALHRITTENFFQIFALFRTAFASHYHPCITDLIECCVLAAGVQLNPLKSPKTFAIFCSEARAQ
jgi:hypothetical protein